MWVRELHPELGAAARELITMGGKNKPQQKDREEYDPEGMQVKAKEYE